ncbi:hypothetical protein Tco_1539659 [Tanacetum coccineum]
MADKSSFAIVENGVAEPTSDTPSMARLAESEHATNASSNNDMKGHRTVLPGILQGDKSDLLFYKPDDNGKKIYWNEDFHEGINCLDKGSATRKEESIKAMTADDV